MGTVYLGPDVFSSLCKHYTLLTHPTRMHQGQQQHQSTEEATWWMLPTWPIESSRLCMTVRLLCGTCLAVVVVHQIPQMIGLGYGSYPPVTFPEAVLWIIEMIFMAG